MSPEEAESSDLWWKARRQKKWDVSSWEVKLRHAEQGRRGPRRVRERSQRVVNRCGGRAEAVAGPAA